MNYGKTIAVALILCAAILPYGASAQHEGALTPEVLIALERSLPLDGPTVALMNAVTKIDVKSIALSRKEAISTDTYFTHKIKTQGVTNQEKTGRCWLFAGLNILRPVASKKINIKQFEFSQTYLFFYDKLEKANLFLEAVIETREQPLSGREVEWLLTHPMMDGGQWNMVLALIDKYGVVPAEVMPETESSANTGRLNSVLSELLCKQASELRAMTEKGAGVSQLRDKKTGMLKDIYRVLVLHMGVPPAKFAWRYEDAESNVTAPVEFTPKRFYKEFVNIDLKDYVCLHSIPLHAYDKAYQVQFDRNLVDSPNMTFVNVPVEKMKEYTLKSLMGDDPVWFGCDVGKESDSKLGVMKLGLYDYKSIYGIDTKMSKEDRIQYHQSVPSHAMVFTGVDVVDGKPLKWLVENSWGSSVGDKGMFTMYDDWFDEYMFSVIIHKKYLPQAVVTMAETENAEVLPPWDPLFSYEPK